MVSCRNIRRNSIRMSFHYLVYIHYHHYSCNFCSRSIKFWTLASNRCTLLRSMSPFSCILFSSDLIAPSRSFNDDRLRACCDSNCKKSRLQSSAIASDEGSSPVPSPSGSQQPRHASLKAFEVSQGCEVESVNVERVVGE